MADRQPLNGDAFGDFARYYDTIMSHVDYDRWVVILGVLSELAPQSFRHIDVGCGTGTLAKHLRTLRWNTIGFDLSQAMVRVAAKEKNRVPAAVADMSALPLRNQAHVLSCLFDSLNFVLTSEGVYQTMASFADALVPGGILYFDVVTEKMVTTHFADKKWKETNDGIPTTWDSRYARDSKLSETHISLGNGVSCVVREQVHDPKLIESAVKKAGLTLLGVFDAETWKPLRRGTIRADYVAIKSPTPAQLTGFKSIPNRVRALLT